MTTELKLIFQNFIILDIFNSYKRHEREKPIPHNLIYTHFFYLSLGISFIYN